MPTVDCPCGHSFESRPGTVRCERCGTGLEVPENEVLASCTCGKRLNVPGETQGSVTKCGDCGRDVFVPMGAPPAPARVWFRSMRTEVAVGGRKRLRWLLALALLPLLLSMFSEPGDIRRRLHKTLEEHPEVIEELDPSAPVSEIFRSLPDNRINGALHGRFTLIHWGYAAASALLFWGFIVVAFPLGSARSRHLWLVGIFTGTAGILMLLTVQAIAAGAEGIAGVGGIVRFIFYYFFKFVEHSYRAAESAESGFFLTLIGFTLGVGLAEEIVKALPIMWCLRKGARLDVRAAATWGLASGIGFGVGEAVIYCSDFYNGLATGGIYVVRFVSCVSIHAVWGGAAAVLLCRWKKEIQNAERWYHTIGHFFAAIAFVTLLHGVYDTALRRGFGFTACMVAVLSFAWFIVIYERSCREEGETLQALAQRS